MTDNMTKTRGTMTFRKAYDYRTMVQYLGELCVRYPNLELGYLGTSILDRPIPVVTVGQDKRSRGVLYLGGLHGTDLLTPGALLQFLAEYAESLRQGRRMYNVNLPYLFENRTIHVVPMLNPDGYEIRRYGAEDDVVRERLLRQNGGNDFRKWRGNARGVDLWRNFTESPERPGDEEKVCPEGTAGLSPESEPEVAALCNYLRIYDEIESVLTLHTTGKDIRCSSGDCCPARSRTLARLLSRMTGGTVETVSEPDGTLTDWFIRERNKPAFDCGILLDKTVDLTDPAHYTKIHAVFRESLFSMALLI